MKVCLISPPTVTDFEDSTVAESEAVRLIAEHAPVGILSLAAVLDGFGITPHVVDLNRLYYDYLQSNEALSCSSGFLKYLTQHLEPLAFDLFGLSTICSSYPLTIRLARELKRIHPEATVVLGGPQATVVDVATLAAFPSIDFIVRGEAEETFPLLLDALSCNTSWGTLPGITYRRGGAVIRNQNAPVIRDLDALPTPAYHLYPYLKDCQYIPLELGRGCPFACTFCSTNDFFRRNFRLKSPERIIGEMRILKETYGVVTFDLIHDMFTVDRKRVVAFCEALLECGEQFYWNCSARTDCIDDDLIDLMARAGCRGIFFGIETGSARMQQSIKKRLDLTESAERIRCADQHGITTAVSLITGFPDETMEDLKDTVSFLVDSLRFDHAAPQLHILAPLAETPLHTQYRDQLILDDIFSDMSYQGWRQDPVDREMIASYPDIFANFYALPTSLDRHYLKGLREFILYGIEWFRWLLVALHQDSGHLITVFDEWMAGHAERAVPTSASATDWSPYYSRPVFREKFLQFIQSHYIPRMGNAKSMISALVEFGLAFDHLEQQECRFGSRSPTSNSPEASVPLEPQAVPMLAQGVHLAQLGADYKEIIQCLRRKERLEQVAVRPVTIVAQEAINRPTEFIQVSAASAQLLRLCDGKQSVREIVERFASFGEYCSDIPVHKVCVFGLELLRQQGLIVVSSAISASSAIVRQLEEEATLGVVDNDTVLSQ